MRRRELLRAAAAGAAAAATWPAWLRRAFAKDACDKDANDDEPQRDGPAALSGAWRRARAAGKPLLVLVIPADDQLIWDRGHAFGELLNHGSPADLAPLALAEVACATAADVRQLVPAARGEPMMFVVETDRVPAQVRGFDVPSVMPDFAAVEARDDTLGKSADAIIADRIAVVAGVAVSALAPDDAAVSRRAAAARARLSAGARAQVQRAIAGDEEPAVELVDRAAAPFLEAGQSGRIDRRRAEALLATAVKHRLDDQPPAGAHWASSWGCGTDIEKTPAEKREQKRLEEEAKRRGQVYFESVSVVGCGMGHVPEKSRRFLYFYAVENERW